jgi:tetratricopeptide (TPR) repeat protein
MAREDFRIFLSAVTSEFATARNGLAADLRARELLLRVQSDFRQEAGSDTTLKKLHDYIRDCSAVVCIVGTRPGAFPPPAAAAPFAGMLPPGFAEASYTQWEFFFARHYQRRLSIYIANDAYQPDLSDPGSEDDDRSQRAFLTHVIKEQGLDRSYFSNEDQLCRAALKEDWPRKREHKLILLPYPPLGILFKGRDDLLVQLRGSLTRQGGRSALLNSVLYGLGGIGKTRAAVEYAWAYEEHYAALLFAVAETPESLHCNLAALAGPHVLNLPEQGATDEGLRVRAVLDWLTHHHGWLLILDNVDTTEALADVDRVIGRLTGGHVIITSRLANFAGHFDPRGLDVLTVKAAAGFLLERTDGYRLKTTDDIVAARALAVELGQLALALEQAGAYIAKLRLPFARYHQLWRENWAKVAGWADETITKYPRAVAATWQTSIAQVSAPARRLLGRLAWLAPEPVPNSLLEIPVPDIPPEDQDEALADLAGYSLASRNPENQEFAVHRLVQEVTRRSLDEQERHSSLVEALNWIDAGFEGDPLDVRTWPRLDSLAAHVREVAEHASIADICVPTARLMSRLSNLCAAKGRYSEAETLALRALGNYEKAFGPAHPDTAGCMNNLANLVRDRGDLTAARPLYERAIDIQVEALGATHPHVAASLNNLAYLLQDQGELTEARHLLERALAIRESALGADHPETATSLSTLGNLLRDLGDLGAAGPLFVRAMTIREKTVGSDHPHTAATLTGFASYLQVKGDLIHAEELFERAHAIRESALGPDHPHTAASLTSLASLLQIKGDLARAGQLLEQAMAIYLAALGHDHPDTNRARYHRARLFLLSGQPTEAFALGEIAFSAHDKILGKNSRWTQDSVRIAAEALDALDRSAEGTALLARFGMTTPPISSD